MVQSLRTIKAIQDVVDWGLCTGCGACYYACGSHSVSLVNIVSVGIRPKFDAACAACTDCLSICPGYSVDGDLVAGSAPKRTEAEHEFGPALEIWEGHATDPEIRHHASSGGILSALALYCLERESMEFVLHTGMDDAKPWANSTVQSRNRSELLSRTGSRYAPASPCDGLESIERSDRPCVFIGKPCDCAATSKLRRQRPELDRKLGLVLTFFCAGTPSTQGTLDLMASLDIRQDETDAVRYRGGGWPGQFTVSYDHQTSAKSLSYTDSWENSPPTVLCDVTRARTAWAGSRTSPAATPCTPFHGGKNPGLSIVVVRTRRGQEILHAAIEANDAQLKPIGAAAVLAAQPNLLGRRREIFGRLLAMRLLLIPVPKFTGFSLFRSWNQNPVHRSVAHYRGNHAAHCTSRPLAPPPRFLKLTMNIRLDRTASVSVFHPLRDGRTDAQRRASRS